MYDWSVCKSELQYVWLVLYIIHRQNYVWTNYVWTNYVWSSVVEEAYILGSDGVRKLN
jgi:hypothetical protein